MLPQRDGRPALDLTPEPTPGQTWDEVFTDPANPLNAPVPLGRVRAPFHNGWSEAGVEEYPTNPAAKKDRL